MKRQKNNNTAKRKYQVFFSLIILSVTCLGLLFPSSNFYL